MVLRVKGEARAVELLLDTLGEDYDESSPVKEVSRRNWFGRCVWEGDNNVCDEQVS